MVAGQPGLRGCRVVAAPGLVEDVARELAQSLHRPTEERPAEARPRRATRNAYDVRPVRVRVPRHTLHDRSRMYC